MNERDVDVAIIGAGTAGLNARKEAEKADASWVLIESGPYGTTCARVGCMPSKLLIAASDAAHDVQRADQFGVRVDPDGWEVDDEAVMERVRSERDRFVDFVVESTEEIPEEKRLRGHARFVGETTLEVGDHTRVEAETVVIATGSSPWVPPSLDGIRDDVLDNAEVFELETLPDSMAVVGTGVIGLELGQALDRLGVETTFFNPYHEVGPLTDPEVEAEATSIFSSELDLRLGHQIEQTDRVEEGYLLRWRDEEGREHDQVFDEVLAAAGRRPNLEGLHLEATGLELDDGGVPVFDNQTMQCGDSPIFIAGDAAGHRNVLHEASDEGRIAGSNAVDYPNVSAATRRAQMAVVFSDPQMAIAGKCFEHLDRDEIAVGEVSYENQGRSRVMGIDRGLVRVYAWREGCTFAGAEMVGPRVEHTSHLLAWAAQKRMSVREMLEMPFYHPVVEEGIRTALRDLAERLEIIGRCRPEDQSETPGD
jgi:dihydrolipoamide dehydrogenase